MLRRLVLAAIAAVALAGMTAPPPSSACPMICREVNGHWVCGCG